MKRLVETSAGRVELDARKVTLGGLSVTISAFDEAGWESGSQVWGARWNDGKTLAQLVTETTGLPSAEAEQIVTDTLREWRERGGDQQDDGRAVLAPLVATFGLAALGLAGLVALGVLLATKVL